MPNLEISADQYRQGSQSNGRRKASFIENLHPSTATAGSNLNTTRKNSHGSSPPQPVKEEVLYRSKSLQLSELTFSDSQGNHKSAQVIHKRTIASNENLDKISNTDSSNNNCAGSTSLPGSEGILSIGILKRHILCDCLILTKRYRPSLKSFVLEFPARIIGQHNSNSNPESDNESDHSSIGDAAVKDVEDNTGYSSTQVKWVSPETAIDPELCDNTLKIVSLEIDGDDPIRNNFFQSSNSSTQCASSSDSEDNNGACALDCLDEVEVIPLPINGLLDRLNEYSRRGTVIDSRVYSFAIGLKQGEKLAQSVAKERSEEVEMIV